MSYRVVLLDVYSAFIAFLMSIHPRLGEKSLARILRKECMHRIWYFLRRSSNGERGCFAKNFIPKHALILCDQTRFYCSTPSVSGKRDLYFDPWWVANPRVAVMEAGLVVSLVAEMTLADISKDIENLCSGKPKCMPIAQKAWEMACQGYPVQNAKELFREIWEKVVANYFVVPTYSQTNPIAVILSVLGSMFNHSCAPNAVWNATPGKLWIHASEDIPEGKEITIPYGVCNKYMNQKMMENRYNGNERIQGNLPFDGPCCCKICTDPKIKPSPSIEQVVKSSEARMLIQAMQKFGAEKVFPLIRKQFNGLLDPTSPEFCPPYAIAVLQDAAYADILEAALLYIKVLNFYCDTIQNRCMALVKIAQCYCNIKDVTSALHYWIILVDLHQTHYGNLEFLRREAEMFGALRMLMRVSDGEHCFKCWQKRETQVCGKCKRFRYCSPECQKADWPEHKKICKK